MYTSFAISYMYVIHELLDTSILFYFFSYSLAAVQYVLFSHAYSAFFSSCHVAAKQYIHIYINIHLMIIKKG